MYKSLSPTLSWSVAHMEPYFIQTNVPSKYYGGRALALAMSKTSDFLLRDRGNQVPQGVTGRNQNEDQTLFIASERGYELDQDIPYIPI